MASRNRGVKKPNLRDLGRHKPSLEERRAIEDQLFNTEIPVVTAILGLALVEIHLEELLRAHFVRRDDDTWNSLTDHGAPLGTLHNKILAAYAFGIVNEVVKDALNTIRLIRNAFAHAKSSFDFSHPLIAAELRKVTRPESERSRLYKALSWVRDEAGKSPTRSRMAYTGLCLVIATELLKKANARERAKTRRLSKKYEDLLRRSLSLNAPTGTLNQLAVLFRNQNEGSGLLSPPPSPKSSGHRAAKRPRSKDA